jgi:hypothetical protein
VIQAMRRFASGVADLSSPKTEQADRRRRSLLAPRLSQFATRDGREAYAASYQGVLDDLWPVPCEQAFVTTR